MLAVDCNAWTVEANGAQVELTFQEFRLLIFLVSHPKKAFQRTELIQQAWDPAKPMSERSVDLYVARLRRKLGAVGYKLIRTVQGIGYRFDSRTDETFVIGQWTDPGRQPRSRLPASATR